MPPPDTAPNASHPASPARRRGLWWAAGATAAVAGGVAAWRAQPAPPDVNAGQLLWRQQFDTPEGQPLDLARLRSQGPLLVNFWATWCPPCVAELPLLDRFGQAHAARGWKVLGLAVDQPSAVRRFLQARPVGFAVGMAGLQGTDLSRNLGNSQGGLPFTVVFAANGAVLGRKIGQLTDADLAGWVQRS